MFIYHIVKKSDWENKESNKFYHPESLEKEGFIHASLRNQILKVADLNYANEDDLLLLQINVNKVKVRIVFEDLYDLHEDYPHIYGELNVNSVSRVFNFTKDNNGKFVFPKERDILNEN